KKITSSSKKECTATSCSFSSGRLKKVESSALTESNSAFDILSVVSFVLYEI
ncbi:unnamed protein product, partial [Musa hybrid cultivar]